jgi:hypothetical protein
MHYIQEKDESFKKHIDALEKIKSEHLEACSALTQVEKKTEFDMIVAKSSYFDSFSFLSTQLPSLELNCTIRMKYLYCYGLSNRFLFCLEMITL